MYKSSKVKPLLYPAVVQLNFELVCYHYNACHILRKACHIPSWFADDSATRKLIRTKLSSVNSVEIQVSRGEVTLL